MRNLIYILLLVSGFTYGQVNFSTYGAVGNGIADDTAALQAAIDAETNLIADAAATFKITSQIDFDSTGDQTINFNNSTILVDPAGTLEIALRPEKPSGRLTIDNMILDGNEKCENGMDISTVMDMDNIEITGMNGTAGVFGIRFNLAGYFTSSAQHRPNAEGIYNITNLDIHHISALDGGNNLGNADGSATGMIIYFEFSPTTQTVLNITDVTIGDIYGSDSSCLFTDTRSNSNVAVANTNSLIDITDGTFHRVERRIGKLFGGNQKYTNCTFTAPDPNDVTMSFVKDTWGDCGTQGGTFCDAGLIGLAMNRNTFENCTFEDPDGYDAGGGNASIFPTGVIDATFNNCSFTTGTDIDIIVNTNHGSTSVGDRAAGQLYFCSATFSSGVQFTRGGSKSYTGDVYFDDTNNVYADGYLTTTANISAFRSEIPLSCPLTTFPVTAVTWVNDTQSITSGQTVNLEITWTPTNATNKAYTLSSDSTDDLSDAGVWVSEGSANLTITADDTTNGTLTDIMAVTTTIPVDTSPPTIQSINTTDVTQTTFKVNWTLDEFSKGWIEYGLSTGSYFQETRHENTTNYISHIQQVGGNTLDTTDPLLLPATLYYYRIWMEDSLGNSAWSAEYTQLTLSEVLAIIRARKIRIGTLTGGAYLGTTKIN